MEHSVFPYKKKFYTISLLPNDIFCTCENVFLVLVEIMIMVIVVVTVVLVLVIIIYSELSVSQEILL